MSKVTGECLRRFEQIEEDNKSIEKRINDLEKFQVAIITIVAVANFLWIFFGPILTKHFI